MFGPIADYLRSRGWSDWGIVQFRTLGGLVWWISIPSQPYPAIVAKLLQSPDAVQRGRNEARALMELTPYRSELGTPDLLFSYDLPAHAFVFGQSGVPGYPLRDELSPFDREECERQLSLIEPWLARFHSRVPSTGSAATALNDLIRSCRENLAARQPKPGVEALLDAADQALPRLEQVPSTPVHGDLWASNVLESKDAVAVVDWTEFRVGGPTEDLHNYTTAAVFASKRGGVAGLWQSVYGTAPLAQLGKSATLRLLARHNLAPTFLPDLFTMFLVGKLAATHFRNYDVWLQFISRYVNAGMPPPFTDA